MAYKIYIDFETRSKLDLKKVGSSVYAADPSTDILCVGVRFNTKGVSILTKEFLDLDRVGSLFECAQGKNTIFVAHNVAFEYAIWHEIMVKRYDYPPIPLSRWKCTLAKAASCGLPQKLELVAKVLQLPAQKDMVGNQSMLTLSKPKKDGSFWQPHEKPEMFDKLYQYCKQDVLVEQQLDERLPNLSAYEQRVWQMNERVNQSGVTLDIPLIKTIVNLSREHKKFLGEEFKHYTGEDFLPSKRAQFKRWLHENGLEVSDTKASTLERLISAPIGFRDKNGEKVYAYQAGAMKLFLEYNKTSLAKYGAMLKRANNDHKLRGMHAYHSAHTGRFAGRGVQLQNLYRGEFKMAPLIQILSQGDYAFLDWAYRDVSKAMSSAIRGMFIPTQDNKFFVGDLSGIEARVLAWIAGQENKLEDFRNGVDPYLKAAQQIYGRRYTGSKEQRAVGKVSELALGYQGGIAAYMTMAEGYHVDLKPMVSTLVLAMTPQEHERCEYDYQLYLKRCKKGKTEPCEKRLGLACSLIKFRWRAANDRIEDFWKFIEQDAIRAIEFKKPVKCGMFTLFMHDIWLCIKLPSGRCIKYPFPKVENKKLSYYTMTIDRGWARVTTYGGSLTENIVQGIARDLFVDDMLAMEDDGKYDIKFHVHDEVVAECGKDGDLNEFLGYLERVPNWATGLLIKAEGWTGDRYEKR